MTAIQLRDEALMMLEGKGAILEVARRVTRVLDETNTAGAIIGGVAVVLHGHVRTTAVVDVYVPGSLEEFGQKLMTAGFEFSAKGKEFLAAGVPVHLVTSKQTSLEPTEFTRIDDVKTVSLPDLINLKLTSGLKNLTRAQDLADVIGLIRAQGLTAQFAARLDKSIRAEFRKLVKAVQKESK
jgi:hypothetical protein